MLVMAILCYCSDKRRMGGSNVYYSQTNQMEVGGSGNCDIDVELTANVDVPNVELEVEYEAPVVEIDVDYEEPVVEIDVEAEVEVDAEVEVEIEAEVEVEDE